jgi:hypothetical protein
MTLAFKVSDMTDRFLGFYEAAEWETDSERRWQLWVEKYRHFPFGDHPEGQLEAKALFEVAWCQYGRVLPRIQKRGSISESYFTKAIEAVADLMGIDEATVQVTLGVGFMNPMHYSAALGDFVYLFFPTDYPYKDPELIFAYLASLAFYDYKFGRKSSQENYDLAEQTMLQGLAMHLMQRVCPGRPLAAYLQANDEWVMQVASRTLELVGDFLDAMELVPHKGLLRGFFWGSDFLEPERTGFWVAYLVVGQLLKTRTLREVSEIEPSRWRQVVLDSCTALIGELV